MSNLKAQFGRRPMTTQEIEEAKQLRIAICFRQTKYFVKGWPVLIILIGLVGISLKGVVY